MGQQLQPGYQEKGRKSYSIKDTNDRNEGENDTGEEARVVLLASRLAYDHQISAHNRTLFSTILLISTRPQATESVSSELEKVCV